VRRTQRTKRMRAKRQDLSLKEQHGILVWCALDAYGRRIVRCTMRTVPLLRMAGVREPRVLCDYALDVQLVEPGFLTVRR
jgi:hypothetical protein